MYLNLGSLSFNANIASGGGNPSWGTELGQGDGYRFSFDEMDDMFTSLVYNSVPDLNNVYCPLGKGGNQRQDYDFVIASHYKKIYVNDIFIGNAEFVLLVVKKIVGDNHVGRRTIKYSPRMTYQGKEINQDCYNKIANTLGLTANSAWFIDEINVRNQDELHFTAYILNSDGPKIYRNSEERKEAYTEHLKVRKIVSKTNSSENPTGDGKKHIYIDIVKTTSPCKSISDLENLLRDAKEEILGSFSDNASADTAAFAYLKFFRQFEDLKITKKKDIEQVLIRCGLYPNSGSGSGISQILNIKNLLQKKSVCEVSLYEDMPQKTSTLRPSKTLPLQVIHYGAPGTGKSFGMDEEIKKYGMKDIRTTFHPDSDYSTFVGAYKPQMEKVVVRDDRGFPVMENGKEVYEKRIVYRYTRQAFLNAYVEAWKDLKNPHVLVIEEINRGNCAQIFGDLFQLLDRNSAGFSSYPINADTDIMQELNDAFEDLQVEEQDSINELYKEDVVTDVLNGSKLLLPNNLYIWATMNTSDQSLFPIDSAFKRRWDWKYIPICDAGKAWMVKVDGVDYDWWDFVKKINQKIWDATHSEDKKLGYFFCKADEQGVVSAGKFVGKVLFYVYNDVFKDYGLDDAIFKDEDGSELLFHKYFNPDGTANEKKIRRLLDNMEVKVVGSDVDNDIDSDVDTDLDSDKDTDGEEESSAATIAPASALRVQFADETIEGETQFDSYLAALKKIGLERVAEVAADMEYARYDCPLVSKKKHDAIMNVPNFSYEEADGYYVIKGVNKRGMIAFLNHVAEVLALDIVAE